MLGALRSAKKVITGQAEAEGRMLAMASDAVMSDLIDGPVPLAVLDEHLRAYVAAESQLSPSERQNLVEGLQQSTDPAAETMRMVMLICQLLVMARLNDDPHKALDSVQHLGNLLPSHSWLNDVQCADCDSRSIVILAMPRGRCPECEARSLVAAS